MQGTGEELPSGAPAQREEHIQGEDTDFSTSTFHLICDKRSRCDSEIITEAVSMRRDV